MERLTIPTPSNALAAKEDATPPGPFGLVLTAVFFALAGLHTAFAPLSAQHTDVPPPAAYALEDVTVVSADGQEREGLTLVLRQGRVEILAPDAEVPAGARVLEGEGLRVYPGLVDAEGDAEFEFPEAAEDDVVPWDPTREQQGFTPHLRVADHLTETSGGLSSPRARGVVASAIHPGGGLMPGQGAVILHRRDARSPDELVLRPLLGPVMAFRMAGQVYPGTLFGVIAFLRQSFEDADRHERLVSAHGRDPGGLAAPRWDRDYEVVRSALTGDTRVWFRADRAEDIRRVLRLSEEHGFRPVVVGGAEAWKVADRLRDRGVPVLVSLDFPEPRRWQLDPDPEPEAEPEPGDVPDAEPEVAGEAPAGADAGQEEEDPLDPAEIREKRDLEDRWANAGRLAEAGVTIALTSGGGEADLLEGARKAMEHGLASEDALRALTVTPAAMLGASWLADPLAEGRTATFFVTDGPLFDEDTQVLYTFVEGRLERGAGVGEQPEEPAAVDLTGTWSMAMETDGPTVEGTLEIRQRDSSFSGTFSTQFGEMSIRSGVVSGNDVTFSMRVEVGGQSFSLHFRGTATEDRMRGSGSGPPDMVGRFSWSAERTGGPGGAR